MEKIQVRFDTTELILMLMCSGLAGMACIVVTRSFICGLAVAILTFGAIYFCATYLEITFRK